MGLLVLPVLRVLAWVYVLLPRFVQWQLGQGLGFFLRLLQPRREVVTQNLDRAYPGNDSAALTMRTKLFRAAYMHLGHLSWEALMVLGPASPMRTWTRKWAHLEGLDHIHRALEKGNGAIILASHVGNWEILSAMGANLGLDLLIVTKRLQPAWFHEAAEKGRRSYGVNAAYEPKTLQKVLKHLKRGGTVGFIMDQYAGPPIGVRVPFFGTAVGTPNIIATLAKRTGAQVIPAQSFRSEGDRHFYCRVFPPVDWISDSDPKRELALNTARYAQIVEAQVREHPEQWLWTHRRFKGDLSPLREEEWSLGRVRGG